jgi:hypothetical protein
MRRWARRGAGRRRRRAAPLHAVGDVGGGAPAKDSSSEGLSAAGIIGSHCCRPRNGQDGLQERGQQQRANEKSPRGGTAPACTAAAAATAGCSGISSLSGLGGGRAHAEDAASGDVASENALGPPEGRASNGPSPG